MYNYEQITGATPIRRIHSLPITSNNLKLNKFVYLQTVQYHNYQAQPAVQTVHVGDIRTIVEVKNCHQRYNSKNEGH